jgi:hypothetical protein
MKPKNPYSDIVKIMQDQGAKYNTPYIQLGVVISPDPLTIQVGDLQVSKDNLMVADYLLPNYARKYTATGNIQLTESGSIGATDGTVVGPYGSHTHNVITTNLNTNNTQNGDITLTDGFNANDVVALSPTLDGQTYIVFARLVSP